MNNIHHAQQWMQDIKNAAEANNCDAFEQLYRTADPAAQVRGLAMAVQYGRIPMMAFALQHAEGLKYMNLSAVFEKGASKGQVETTTRALEWANTYNTFVAHPPYAFTLAMGALRSDCRELLERNWAEIKTTKNDLLHNLYGSAAVNDAGLCLGFLDQHLPRAEQLRMGALSQAVRLNKAVAVLHMLRNPPSFHNTTTEAANLLWEMMHRNQMDAAAVDTVSALLEYVSFEEFNKRFGSGFKPHMMRKLETLQAQHQHKILSAAIEEYTPSNSVARKM